MRVYVHGGAATPTPLLDGLVARARSLRGIETVSLHLEGPAPHVAPELAGHIRHNALFIGANVREAVNSGRADFTPVFLSDVPALFSDGTLPLDAALIQVSPPNEEGLCSLGVAVDVARPAATAARYVVAEVNARMPFTFGASTISLETIDAWVETDRPLHTVPVPVPSAEQQAIGRQVASLIDDGATLQLGIGAVAEAVLGCLRGHRDLGVHTEMFSDGVVDLVEAGAITGARKRIHAGLIVSSFVLGTERLYRWVDRNPMVSLHDSSYTNDPRVIAAHEEMVAVNSAIEVDLTGQVCADSIGPKFWSGIGGQLDFIRGAARAPGGRPIIALPSTALDGTRSRIVSQLAPGAGVVTTRGDVYFVVTEHGVAALHGRSVRERAQALLDIAHPAFREALARESFALHGFRLKT
ncbi:MAG: acetyl-CoA hydrolase/transferase C-terminal domain-containing protein [Dehalococcoidia bacterium]